ncbi:hypothetical protein DL93DRAFT_2154592, partial [Clavulina sp. PMI_390]
MGGMRMGSDWPDIVTQLGLLLASNTTSTIYRYTGVDRLQHSIPHAMSVIPTPAGKPALDRGAACFWCRKLKIKCDGLKPQCSRCSRLRKNCVYATTVQRRQLVDAIGAKTLKQELASHKIILFSAHSLLLLSKKLHERVGRLGKPLQAKHQFNSTESSQLLSRPEYEGSEAQHLGEELLGDDTIMRHLPAIRRLVEQELSLSDFGISEDPSPLLSTRLINLFLPFRRQYCSLVDVTHFARSLSLPSSHPESIHRCLLNACYLGACASNGGILASFKPLFLDRTRHFMQQSLMFSDRILHFLWANCILGGFYVRERRLMEAMVLAGTPSSFAI